MPKKYSVALLLSCTSYVNAAYYQKPQHVELSYDVDCLQVVCHQLEAVVPQQLTFVTPLQQQPTLKVEDPSLPRYLTISDTRDWAYLRGQTYTILGLSVATVGLMTLLPESITKWDEEDRNMSGLGQKWKDNVTSGPTWDRDEHFLNYIMHPYFGGVYYTSARHAGFNELESFLYSATMSSFFWEYGVEAFAEIPSWQDLFITPFFGAVVGEMMFEKEQDIVANGGEVFGSQRLGSISLFLLNPVGHIHSWVSDAWRGSAEVTFQSTPWLGDSNAAKFAFDSGAKYDRQFYGVDFKISF